MENEEPVLEQKWLEKLAAHYNGNLPYQNETEVILWLKKRASEPQDTEERRRYRALIEEAEDFGGRDDWGKMDPDMMSFAKFLKILESRFTGRQDI